MRPVLGFLVLFLASTLCQGAGNPAFEVWVYSLYPNTITRHKVRPFVEYLGEETRASYDLTASSDVSTLLQRCRNDGPDIVFTSLPLSEKISAQCGYRYIAVTYQDVFLYALVDLSIKTPKAVKRIGVLKDIEATKIGLKELNAMGLSFEIVEYPTFLNLMKNFRKDGIQGAIFNSGGLALSRTFNKKWESIHEFSEKGVAAVLLSPKLDSEISGRIARVLLSNDAAVASVFQGSFGLGPFLEPRLTNNVLLK